MKSKFTPKRIISGFVFSLATIFSFNTYAQQTQGWTADPFDYRVFIENKGQFDNNTDDKNVPVLYSQRVQGCHTYWTANGICYSHNKVEMMTDQQKDSMVALNTLMSRNRDKVFAEDDNGKYHWSLSVPIYMKMIWLNCNTNAEVVAEHMVPNYFTYPADGSVNSKTIIASAYEKITYKNLYPNIDVEYIIPKDKEGIKYNLILHPGADLSVVKMQYNYAKSVIIDASGNVVVESEFGQFIDHAPQTFYQDSKQEIKSSFELNGNVVSFKTDNYNTNKTIVVDPWTTNPLFPTWNRAYDVVFDRLGNVYAYGGNFPWQLAKFNNAGVLQWTYSAAAMYNSGCCTGSCYGDVAVDEPSGTCYLSEGFDWSAGSRVFKINTLGVQTAASVGNPLFNEIWRMEYNRCINTLVGSGGGTSCCFQAIIIDTNLTVMNPVNVYGTGPGTDNCLMSIDPTTNFVYLSTTGGNGPPNPMIKCPIPALLPVVYTSTTGFNFTEIGSVMYATNGCCANGFNGMSASLNWLYAYDGLTLKKFNKMTGAQVGTVGTGGTMYASGGTTSDVCDNVFVGVGNQIKQYNAALVQIGTIATNGTTYDVVIGPNNGKIYASGDGFVQELTVPLNTSSISLTQTPSSNCSNCNGTATANITICGVPSPNVGYSWSPSGQTTQTATGLCPGLYSITISTTCGVTISDTITVQAIPGGGFTLTPSTTGSCQVGVGTATATPVGGTAPFVYSWNTVPPQNTQTATGLPTGSYTCYVTDANGCSDTVVVTITVGSGVTSSLSASSNVSCFSGSNGSATVNPTGGNTPYTYSWTSIPSQNTVTATGLGAGTYTCYVTDAGGCTDTTIVTITQPTQLTVTSTSVSICANATATLTATTGGGTPGYVVTWNPGALNGTTVSVTPTATTTYTITVTDANGCTTTANVTVTVGAPLLLTASNPVSLCSGVSTTLTATATGGGTPYTYNWMPGAGTNSTFTVTPTTTTTYTVTVTDNCSTTITSTVTVTVNPLPTVAFNPNDSSGCVPLCVNFANSSSSTTTCAWTFSGGTPAFSSSATPNNICYNTPGQYNVGLVITDANGCSSTLIINQLINVYPIPVANFSLSTQTTTIFEPDVCFTNLSQGATILSWNFGDPLSTPQNNTSTQPMPCHTYSDTGTYCVTLYVANANGCLDTIDYCLIIGDVFTFYAPNAFTPNGTGVNDTWTPQGVNIDPNEYQLWIYDRWGNMIFQTSVWGQGWDGKVQGGGSNDIVQEDVYVWKVKCKDIYAKKHEYVGHISVIK